MNLALLLSSLFLIIFGCVNLFGIRPDLLSRHLVILLVGIVLYTLVRPFRTHFLKRNAFVFYSISLLVLVGTYFWGVEVQGSTRWIDVFFFRFQPSEVIKIMSIVFISDLFARFRPHQSPHALLVKILTIAFIPITFIILQPDLGSAIILFLIIATLVLFSPIPKKIILTLAVIGILIAPLGWFGLHDYQKNRITSFVSFKSSGKASYNMVQATIAIGSGKFTGKGLGLGKQAKLSFLPEYHTDFAFSSLIEQFGFLGGILLFILYAVLLFNLFWSITKVWGKQDEASKYQFFYLIGLSAFFTFQMIINTGMNLGLLPVTGITLPFISYGGSSLLISILGLALIP